MEKRTCSKCGKVIPQGRIAALPDTDTCVMCSNVRPRTAADVEIDASDCGQADGDYKPDPSYRQGRN